MAKAYCPECKKMLPQVLSSFECLSTWDKAQDYYAPGNFPGIKERICDETGKVRRFVNVYVNGDDIRFLQNLETALKEGDNISIVPAIAGGRDH